MDPSRPEFIIYLTNYYCDNGKKDASDDINDIMIAAIHRGENKEDDRNQ
jgi:hypothetical protein